MNEGDTTGGPPGPPIPGTGWEAGYSQGADQGTGSGAGPQGILVVDDDEHIRTLLLRILEDGGYEGTEAANAAEARLRLRDSTYDAILIDARMPGESGIDLLQHVAAEHTDTAAIMVTASDDREMVETAFRLGAYGYVVKPFRTTELLISISNALHRRDLEIRNRNHIRELEEKVAERTRLLREAITPLPDPDSAPLSVEEVIGQLSGALTVRDEETGFHILRMSDYSALLAERAGLAGGHSKRIRLAAALHDVGKIGIRDAILRKPGPLTPEEYREMQRHTTIGHNLLSGSESPLLRLGATIALTHHERWDGSGYPNGLAGEAIPPEGRVTAIADVFDALTSDRIYRPAFPVDDAIHMMEEWRGTHFEPRLLDVFLAAMPDVLALRAEHLDPPRDAPA